MDPLDTIQDGGEKTREPDQVSEQEAESPAHARERDIPVHRRVPLRRS